MSSKSRELLKGFETCLDGDSPLDSANFPSLNHIQACRYCQVRVRISAAILHRDKALPRNELGALMPRFSKLLNPYVEFSCHTEWQFYRALDCNRDMAQLFGRTIAVLDGV